MQVVRHALDCVRSGWNASSRMDDDAASDRPTKQSVTRDSASCWVSLSPSEAAHGCELTTERKSPGGTKENLRIRLGTKKLDAARGRDPNRAAIPFGLAKLKVSRVEAPGNVV